MSGDLVYGVVVITSGLNKNLDFVINEWERFFQLGVNLFLCGPEKLLGKSFPIDSIIHYDENVRNGCFFNINKKKHTALKTVKFEYSLVVHDRFYPANDFKYIFNDFLLVNNPDFGGLDIYNVDGTLSLTELRLKKYCLDNHLSESLNKKGRLVTCVSDLTASNRIGINGGAFFINNKSISILNRPFRWSEMEDDVMSFDLQLQKGLWFSTSNLFTIVQKNIPFQSDFKNYKLTLKYYFYGIFCSLLSKLLNICYFKKSFFVSVSSKFDLNILDDKSHFFIVDPIHKFYSAEHLISAPEKVLCRLRANNIDIDISVKSNLLGWEFSFYE